MPLHLACIVEGHGEYEAVSDLIRRIQRDVQPTMDLVVGRPIRKSRHQLTKKGELERAVELAARKVRSPGAILILLDADDDPPCLLGPDLLERARQARRDVPIGLVLAKYEFEAWFLAAIESLSGERGLGQDLAPVEAPESIRDAKGALTERMIGSWRYSPVPDQPALTALFDMAVARQRSASFDKCWREISRLLTLTAQLPPG
jgi:hypothetical protein